MKIILIIAICLLVVATIIIVWGVVTKWKFVCNKLDNYENNPGIHIVNFSHGCCKLAQELCNKKARELGADQIFSLTLDTLSAPERVKSQIRNNKRGAGWWVFKPYAIKQVLMDPSVKENDIIVYMDASTYLTKPVDNLRELMRDRSFCVTKISHLQKTWTKGNAAVAISGQDLQTYCRQRGNNKTLFTCFICIKNDPVGNSIIDDWSYWMDPYRVELYNDSSSPVGNCSGFKESRHDQMILCLLLEQKYPDIFRNTISVKSLKDLGLVYHYKNRHD